MHIPMIPVSESGVTTPGHIKAGFLAGIKQIDVRKWNTEK